MNLSYRVLGVVAAAALAVGALGVGLATAQTAAPTPPTAEDFSRTAAIRQVTISPDGKHIAAIRSDDGIRSVVSIWSVADMKKPATNIGCGDRGDCQGVQFVKNDRIGVVVRQLVTEGTDKDYRFRLMITDLEGKDWKTTTGDSDQGSKEAAQVLDLLPRDPKNILVMTREGAFKLNVYTGSTGKIYNRSDKFFGEQTDNNGEIRARATTDYEGGRLYVAQYVRDPKTNAWTELFRYFAADREQMNLIGFTEDPNIAYVQTNKGTDKAKIVLYDITAKKPLEDAFGIKFFDATGVRTSNAAKDVGRLLGFSYDGAAPEDYWVDPQLDGLQKGLRKALGIKTTKVAWVDPASGDKANLSVADGADVKLNSWSDDFKYAIVVKTGASTPAEYYLLTDGGQLTLLGKQRPWMTPAKLQALGSTRLIQYAARDGLMVPAYLTSPNPALYGPGPYPTIVTPHGGPWARDYLGWDGSGWTQYFASRGYAVLQPQYRGSDGWGQKLWRAGDSEWGQKMQDDMDDGVKYLIAQKVTAADRVAMHGYSYGGYAAMAASVRPNNIYQCSVAGAGVAELDQFRERLNQGWLREAQRPTINGLQPLDHAGELAIPIFLYHGELDVTVPITQSERFVAAAKRSGKPVKFLELKNMGHQSNKWEPGQVGQVLSAIDTYLRTECGPGGL